MCWGLQAQVHDPWGLKAREGLAPPRASASPALVFEKLPGALPRPNLGQLLNLHRGAGCRLCDCEARLHVSCRCEMSRAGVRSWRRNACWHRRVGPEPGASESGAGLGWALRPRSIPLGPRFCRVLRTLGRSDRPGSERGRGFPELLVARPGSACASGNARGLHFFQNVGQPCRGEGPAAGRAGGVAGVGKAQLNVPTVLLAS